MKAYAWKETLFSVDLCEKCLEAILSPASEKPLLTKSG